ncbi:hypothetical protein HGI30_15080 [Paenibacillus albicereus]|uniref:Uncharacterized protein n=1 Tax=Paenibacillus albicereus TaxID=2726185 RepID=A0A6H2GZC4_9BACL|nr:hypothetical protein [Paenibacillus albicereus]QJC52755.1 hypothetical protein HGI30_15080 [Paenibacillus albicereus]
MTHEEMERLFEQESRRLEQHLKEQITAKQEREAIACHVAKLREFRPVWSHHGWCGLLAG